MVAVLLAAIARALAPGADDPGPTPGDAHPPALQQDLVRLHRPDRAAPAVAVLGAALGGLLVDDMTVTGRNDQGAARQPGLMQQGPEQAQVVQVPAQMELIRPAQVVVHDVVDHPHQLACRTASRTCSDRPEASPNSPL